MAKCRDLILYESFKNDNIVESFKQSSGHFQQWSQDSVHFQPVQIKAFNYHTDKRLALEFHLWSR